MLTNQQIEIKLGRGQSQKDLDPIVKSYIRVKIYPVNYSSYTIEPCGVGYIISLTCRKINYEVGTTFGSLENLFQ